MLDTPSDEAPCTPPPLGRSVVAAESRHEERATSKDPLGDDDVADDDAIWSAARTLSAVATRISRVERIDGDESTLGAPSDLPCVRLLDVDGFVTSELKGSCTEWLRCWEHAVPHDAPCSAAAMSSAASAADDDLEGNGPPAFALPSAFAAAESDSRAPSPPESLADGIPRSDGIFDMRGDVRGDAARSLAATPSSVPLSLPMLLKRRRAECDLDGGLTGPSFAVRRNKLRRPSCLGPGRKAAAASAPFAAIGLF